MAPPAPPAALPVTLSQGLLPLGPPQRGHRFPGPGLRCREDAEAGVQAACGVLVRRRRRAVPRTQEGPLGSVAGFLQTSQTRHRGSGGVPMSSPRVSSPGVSNLRPVGGGGVLQKRLPIMGPCAGLSGPLPVWPPKVSSYRWAEGSCGPWFLAWGGRGAALPFPGKEVNRGLSRGQWGAASGSRQTRDSGPSNRWLVPMSIETGPCPYPHPRGATRGASSVHQVSDTLHVTLSQPCQPHCGPQESWVRVPQNRAWARWRGQLS